MDTVDRIVRWLRRHGNYLLATDEPYMQFRAELQDSSVVPGMSVLFLGYSFSKTAGCLSIPPSPSRSSTGR